jgi:hypothetical protein
MSGLRDHRAVVGLVALVLAAAGLVWALDGDDPDERAVGAVAARSRPVATTTPPQVLGDVVVRVPAGEQSEDEPAAAEDLAPGPSAAEPTAPSTSTAPPPPAPAPSPSGSAPPAPLSSPPAPTPPTVTPDPTTTSTPAAAATIELQREPVGRPLQVDLFRDHTLIAGGTLDDVLRFEGLPGGSYELWVSWDTGVLVDEDSGTAISGSGTARHFIDVGAGETVVIHCGERECEVP